MAPSALDALARSQIEALMQRAFDALLIVSSDGTIQYANGLLYDLLGYAPESLDGEALTALAHPDDVPLIRALLEEASAEAAPTAPAIVRARRRDGAEIDLEIDARSFLREPAFDGILLQVRDGSERISVGLALRESEARFREIFDNMLDGLLQIDEDTQALVQANAAFCEIVGYAADEISTLSLSDLFPPEERERTCAILGEHLRGERSVTEALRIKHKDGTHRFVDVGTTKFRFSGARQLLAVVRDVTSRREAERARELFLAVVAHELRTPVAVLKNIAHLLKSKHGSASKSERELLVGMLDEEVERLGRLVSDALDVGALQANSLTLRPQAVALAPLVASVARRVAPQFAGEARLALEDASAYVDPLRFEQVLTNILDNAWRHGGGSAVDVSLVRSGECARIDVTDRGPGFPPEIRHSIFERIFLPHERPTSGIGIGLWLSKRLAVAMGGALVAAAGEDGRGARLTLTVPLHDGASSGGGVSATSGSRPRTGARRRCTCSARGAPRCAPSARSRRWCTRRRARTPPLDGAASRRW